MLYKNIEIHNAAAIVELDDGITWKRFPQNVCNALELDTNQNVCSNSTGVELRFVLKSDEAVIRMASLDTNGMMCSFHVYYGSMQGGWECHEKDTLIPNKPTEFVFKKKKKLDKFKEISKLFGYDYDPEVVRVIFDRGHIKIMDIIGDVEPPRREQTPQKVMLNYGSSITHGSNSIDMSHSWTSIAAHHLNIDCRNLGMAGSCAMEHDVIDYIANEGIIGNWDIATLEMGINVLKWDTDKIHERVTYAIEQIAGKNPSKPIIVISPFYCEDDFDNQGRAENWRQIICEIVNKLNYPNVYYKSGLDFIDNMSYISADMVHPNIYGVNQIAHRMIEYIENNSLLTR